jgi:hypothetical protein
VVVRLGAVVPPIVWLMVIDRRRLGGGTASVFVAAAIGGGTEVRFINACSAFMRKPVTRSGLHATRPVFCNGALDTVAQEERDSAH